MSRRVKHVAVVLSAQTICLGVGLWMHYHFVCGSALDDAKEHAWTALEEDARHIGRQIEQLPVSGDADEFLESLHVEGGGAFLTNHGWQVTAASPTSGCSPGPLGTPVVWEPVIPPAAAISTGQRGLVQLGDGAHLAAAHPLGSGGGFLIVHRSRRSIEERAAAALASLPGISVLTGLWTAVLLGIATFVVLARFHDEAERERSRTLSEQLQQRQTLLRTRDAVIFGLAKLADSRDPETGDHLERISVYSTTLASVLQKDPRYSREVTGAFVRLIGISSALHDIGKVGIEDRVLLKAGPLTAAERAKIQHHAAIGGGCLREIEQRLGTSNFLQMAREIAFAHHERWDGTGYPQGLKGHDIPLSARIVAIADVYDALASRRVYKGARSHEECVRIIREAAGKQFDPELVTVWLTVEGKFREIALRYGNAPPEPGAVDAPAGATLAEFGVDAEPALTPVAGGVA